MKLRSLVWLCGIVLSLDTFLEKWVTMVFNAMAD